jgi:hypothetical protein
MVYVVRVVVKFFKLNSGFKFKLWIDDLETIQKLKIIIQTNTYFIICKPYVIKFHDVSKKKCFKYLHV